MACDLRLCSVFILTEKKERIRFVEYFNDRLVTLLSFTSSAHLAALIKKHNEERARSLCRLKNYGYSYEESLQTFLGLFRNKKYKNIGYWVSDIVMHNLKGSLHVICQSDFANKTYSNTKIRGLI